MCLEDDSMRISDAVRFELDTADDYVAALRHAAEEHPTDPVVLDVFDDVEKITSCAACGRRFAATIRVSDRGLTVRKFCDVRAEEEYLRALVVRDVPDADVFEAAENDLAQVLEADVDTE